MSWLTRCIAVTLLVAVVAPELRGQAPARTEREDAGGLALAPGRRVRLYYRAIDSVPPANSLRTSTWPVDDGPKVVVGTLTSVRRDAVVVDNGGPLTRRAVAVPRANVTRVEVWRGRSMRRTGIGALIGGAATAGLLLYGRHSPVLVGSGAAVGALVGAWQYGERWEPGALPTRWADAAR